MVIKIKKCIFYKKSNISTTLIKFFSIRDSLKVINKKVFSS